MKIIKLKTFTRVLFALVSALVCTQIAEPRLLAGPQGEFQKSISLYDAGKFSESCAILDRLVKDQTFNADIFFNLGNCHYKQEKKGEALAAWFAARKLAPNNPDIKANIKFVLDTVPDKLASQMDKGLMGTVFFWVKSLPQNWWFFLAAGFLFLGFSSLAVSSWVSALEDLTKPAGWILLGLGAFSCLGLGISQNWQREWGAIKALEAEVKSSPGAAGATLFKLSQGAPFALRTAQGDWYQIELSDRKQGWVSKDSASLYRL